MGYKCEYCGKFGKPAVVCDCDGAIKSRRDDQDHLIELGRNLGRLEIGFQEFAALLLGSFLGAIVIFGIVWVMK